MYSIHLSLIKVTYLCNLLFLLAIVLVSTEGLICPVWRTRAHHEKKKNRCHSLAFTIRQSLYGMLYTHSLISFLQQHCEVELVALALQVRKLKLR